MSAPRTPETFVLFELYEASGFLLLITSNVLDAREAAQDGDRIYMRRWSTGEEPERIKGVVRRAAIS